MKLTVSSSGNGGAVASPDRRGPRPRRWGPTGKVDPVCVSAALELGLTPKAAEHSMAESFRRVAIFAKHLLAQGASVRLAHLAAPYDMVIAGAAADVARCAELDIVRCESEADQAEQIAQDILAVAPSREHAIDFLRRSRAARAAALRLEWLVAAKYEFAL